MFKLLSNSSMFKLLSNSSMFKLLSNSSMFKLLVIVQCLNFSAILLCNLLIWSLPDLFWSEFIFEQEFEDTKGVGKSMKLYSIIVYFYKYQRNVLNWLTISDWVERRHFTSLVGYCYYLRWLLPGRHHSGCSVYWDLL
jgi:hypothetical protein